MAASPKRFPALLVMGDDEVDRARTVDQWKAALGEGMADFNLDEREAKGLEDPTDLVGSLMQLPFGAPFRLVVVHDAQTLPKVVTEAIVDYLDHPNESAMLILDTEKIAKNTRLYKAVAKHGAKAVQLFETPKPWKMPPRVDAMAKEKGLTLGRGAAEELISRVGTSMVMLDNSLDTLVASMGVGATIDAATMARSVARVVEPKPWDLVDAVSARNTAKALELYRLMVQEEPIRIFSSLVNRIREMICMKSMGPSAPMDAVGAALGTRFWPRKFQDLKRWTGNFTPQELQADLVAAAACERVLKGTGDERLALERWIIDICRGTA